MTSGDQTKGHRVYPDENGKLIMPESSYGKDQDGVWWVRPPNCNMGPLTEHTVEEHDDGTITVQPSIHLPDVWHGVLRQGVFKEI